jgi:hypothetical protein
MSDDDDKGNSTHKSVEWDTPAKDEAKQPEKELKRTIKIEGRTFEFGKPKAKHRDLALKVLKRIEETSGDLNGIDEVVRKRGLTPDQAAMLDESDYTVKERKMMMNYKGIKKILDDRIASPDYPDWNEKKTLWDVLDIPNLELTDEENEDKNTISSSLGVINDILEEVIICSVHKTSFIDIRGNPEGWKEWIREDMTYDDGVVLFYIGLQWIKLGMKNVMRIRTQGTFERKN